MNPKTARRLLLIAAVVVVVVASLVSVFVVRTWQITRRADALRSQGLDHFEKKEYASTLDKLGPYLRVLAHQTDRQALIVYGKAREAIEEGNLRHIRESIAVYRTAFELDPTDHATGLTLLRHYNTIGFSPEARDLAVRLRPANLSDTTARDLEALRGEVTARIVLKAYDAQLDKLLGRIIELAPDDFGAHLTWIHALRQTGRPEAAVVHTRDIVQRFNTDPRFQYIEAIAKLDDSGSQNGSVDAFFKSLCTLSGLDPQSAERREAVTYTDPMFIARLIGSFDATFHYPHSLAVLREASARIPDADLLRAFVRRAWQAGSHQEVVDRLASNNAPISGTHSELLAFKAMSLTQLGRGNELAAIVEELKRRRDDFRARAWALALDKFTDTSVAGRVASVKNLQAAQREDPSEPILAFALGEALVALDRTEEAREQWQLATTSPLSNGWAAPHSRNSATLVGQGRLDEALRAAERSRQISPGDPVTNIALLGAKLAMIEAGYRPQEDPQAMLAQIERALAQTARVADDKASRGLREVLIPGRVLLLAFMGDAEGASSALKEELDRTPPADPSVLAHLALISGSYKLGHEYECLDLAQKVSPSDPVLGLTRALLLHRDGKTEEGARSITAAAAQSDPSQSKGWKIAEARYLDSINSERSLPNWIDLADANPEDLQVQLAAIESRAASADLAFVDRVGQRVARLGGSDSQRPTITGRLARVRAILASDVTKDRRDEVLSLIRSVTNEAPDLLEPRRLMVQALLLENPERGIKPDFSAAVEQLKALSQIVPDRSTVSLQIAQIYQRQRDRDRARDELNRVLSDASAPRAARERALEMLLAQREYAAAIPSLQADVSAAGKDAPPAMLLNLATALRGSRRTDEALTVFRRLAAGPISNGEQVFSIADGLATCGDRSEAVAVIAKVDALKQEPGVAEWIRGRFEARHGDPTAAAALLERSVELGPKSSALWHDLVTLHLSRRDFAKARDAVERGLKSVPESQELAVLQQQVAIGADGESASLAALIETLSKDPRNGDRVAGLKAVEDARVRGQLSDVKSLSELASKFPDDAGVQAVVLRSLLDLRPPRLDLAVNIAKRSQASFPDSPGIARLSVAAFRASGDWTRMQAAALAWEQAAGSVESRLALAEAELRGGRASRAMNSILPLIESAKAAPDESINASVLELACRAMIDLDREPDAFAILSPLLAGSSAVRSKVWPGLVASAIKTGAAAERWSNHLLGVAQQDDATAREAIAGACLDAAQRTPDRKTELLNLAKSVLSKLAAASAPSDMVLARLGLAQQMLGESQAAAASYRRALEINPKSATAMSNLTDLAIAGGADLNETLAAAERAVAAGEAQDGMVLFALAKLQTAKAEDTSGEAAGAERENLRKALASYRSALSLIPDQFEIALRAGDLYGRLGDQAAALEMFDRVLLTPNLAPQVESMAQNNAAFALLQLKRNTSDLSRARDLARSAVKTQENASFLDTLGQVELAVGDRPQAQAAFRRALQLEPALGSSLLGLAAALQGGTDVERTEASQVLARAESLLLTRPQEYSAEERAAIKALRAKLSQAN